MNFYWPDIAMPSTVEWLNFSARSSLVERINFSAWPSIVESINLPTKSSFVEGIYFFARLYLIERIHLNLNSRLIFDDIGIVRYHGLLWTLGMSRFLWKNL